jgi:hypothetical protein
MHAIAIEPARNADDITNNTGNEILATSHIIVLAGGDKCTLLKLPPFLRAPLYQHSMGMCIMFICVSKYMYC